MKYLLNWIMCLFDKNDWKLGSKIFEEAREFKLSGVTASRFGLFIATSRTHDYRPPQQSRLYLDGQLVYQGGDETIGKGAPHTGSMFFAGENGNLLRWTGGVERLRRLGFATALVEAGGVPVVIEDDDGLNRGYSCLDNQVRYEFTGGRGIITQAVWFDGRIIGGIGDGDDPGFTGSDGGFIPCRGSGALCEFQGELYGSRGNQVVRVEWAKKRLMEIEELPCQKIMRMAAWKNKLWVVGVAPDGLWTFDRVLRRRTVHQFDEEYDIGGSAFGGDFSGGYYGRSVLNHVAQIYEVQ